MGYITYGKTHSKRGQAEIVPDDERIKVIGTHEKLKTQEEHDWIVEWLAKSRVVNPNGRRNLFPLSGLLHCEKCGYKMQFKVGFSKQREEYWSVLCNHFYKDGSKCEQKGKLLDNDFYEAFWERIVHVDANQLREIELHGNRFNETQALIKVKEQELAKQKRALEK